MRASLTERARREICRRVGEELDSLAAVVREFGVGWACAHQAVIDYGVQWSNHRRLPGGSATPFLDSGIQREPGGSPQ